MKRSALFRTARGVVVAAALVGGSFLLGGCSDTETVTVPNVFHTTPERPLADVPVPSGFRFKEQGSYIFDRNYRVARLRYSGTPHADEAVGFFKKQMPLSKWAFVREADSEEGKLLFFRNDIEDMKVTVDRQAGLTTLEIDISPKKS